ncbi:unnamed protein product [Symbiodinium sp. CCMP2592]|nr:unnamed protein product [Symbiodinium sp. CCMP2592]
MAMECFHCAEALSPIQSGSTKGGLRRKRWADLNSDDEQDAISHWVSAKQEQSEAPETSAPAACSLLQWDPVGISQQPSISVDSQRVSDTGKDGGDCHDAPGLPENYDTWSSSTRAVSWENGSETDVIEDLSPLGASSLAAQPGSSPRVLLSTVPTAGTPKQKEPAAPVAVAQVHPGMTTPAIFVAVPAPSFAVPMGFSPMQRYPGYPMLLQGPAPHAWSGLDKQIQAQGFSPLGRPPFGRQHRFHKKSTSMGELDADGRTFTHGNNKGRLSIICERRIHFQGIERYAVQFVDGELCSADGVGYVISCDLPCTKKWKGARSKYGSWRSGTGWRSPPTYGLRL